MKSIQTAQNIVSLVERIEEKFEVETWNYSGIDFWPVLRVAIYYELSLSLLNNQIVPQQTIFKKLERASKAFISLLMPVKMKDVLLVSDGISYVYLQEGKLYERFCDPIIEILEEKNITWIKWDLLQGNYFKNAVKPSQNLFSKLDFVLLFKKKNEVQLPNEFDDFLNYLKSETAGSINWSTADVQQKLSRILDLKDWYLHRFKRRRPKIVLIVSYYSDRGMALISACSELNIPIADIQHGVQSKMHLAYAGWKLNKKNSFNTLPTDFLTWSLSDKEIIDEWASKTLHRAHCIGNLFENNWRKSGNSLVVDFDRRISEITALYNSAISILFTLQYGIVYESYVYDFIKATEHSYFWLFRFHPLMSENEKSTFLGKLKELGIKNYEYERASSFPLYSWLRNVNIHLTHSSSTVLEALNFGLNSIVYHPYGAELFKSEIMNGNVYYLERTDGLFQLVSRLANSKFVDTLANDTSDDLSKNIVLNEYMRKYI